MNIDIYEPNYGYIHVYDLKYTSPVDARRKSSSFNFEAEFFP